MSHAFSTTVLAHGNQWTADEFVRVGLQIVGVAGMVIALAVGHSRLARPTRPETRRNESEGVTHKN